MDSAGSNPRFLGTLLNDYADWSRDGEWLVIPRQNGLYRVPKWGGEAALIGKTSEPPYTPRVSRDGGWIYYNVISGPPEHRGVWRMSIDGRAVSRLTQMDGPRGRIGYFFAASERDLYVTWVEDDSDIWVMDVVGGGDR